MKAYFGLGISKGYIDLARRVSSQLEQMPYESITFIIADTPQKRYNTDSPAVDQKISELERVVSEIQIPGKTVDVKTWEYFEKQESYKNYFSQYCELYSTNPEFRKDVNDLVMKNRDKLNSKNIFKRSKYVLAELAIIAMLADDYTKIGPEKEIYFDNLAKKYPLDKKITDEKFKYVK